MLAVALGIGVYARAPNIRSEVSALQRASTRASSGDLAVRDAFTWPTEGAAFTVIYGGSFDPPHRGHLAVQQQLGNPTQFWRT